ncbi:MAG: glycosyltransferase [Gemmatimonadetes bacterium]|nr:glycosyltransferase [Gemmatimonadota bacterium]
MDEAATAISVIVPCLNDARHVAACVESLLAQVGVRGGYEVIFVDNGSTDDSAGIARRYDEITVLDEPVAGAYAARNTGIRRARGEVIAFTDADCVISEDWLQRIQTVMRDPAVALAVGKIRYPETASPLLHALARYENAKLDYVVERGGTSRVFAHANNMAVRASAFEELGLFEEWPRAADSELAHRISRRRPELRVVYDDSMLVTHMEFTSAFDRLKRLGVYRRSNARIEDFEELSALQRLETLRRMLPPRGHR